MGRPGIGNPAGLRLIPPKFGAASYSFEITTLSKSGDAVGGVAAIGINGDRVPHEITAGNPSGAFAAIPAPAK